MTFKARGCFDPSQMNHIERRSSRSRCKKSKSAARAEKRERRIQRFRSMSYADYLMTPHWKKKRAKIISRHGGKCCRCGSRDGLQVHHKTYERLGDERMDDLELLCRGCHENEHEGEKFWIRDPMTREFVDRMG